MSFMCGGASCTTIKNSSFGSISSVHDRLMKVITVTPDDGLVSTELAPKI